MGQDSRVQLHEEEGTGGSPHVPSIDPVLLSRYKVAFAALDTDHSGSISLEEMASGLQLSREKCLELLKKGDANSDGELDFNEFVRLMTDKDTDLTRGTSLS